MVRKPPREQVAPRRSVNGSPQLPRHAPWQRIRLDSPIRLLGRADIILVGGNHFLVAGIDIVVLGALGLDLHPIRTWRNGGDWPRYRDRRLPGFTTLESAGLAAGFEPAAAFFLPGLIWRGILAPRIIEGSVRMTADEAFARLPLQRGRRVAAIAEVDRVRAEYGRVLADIAYRIENSALFDSSVPPTRQLETALALFSDVIDATPDDEVVRRSAMVVVAFRTARLHAETIGLAHLPVSAHHGARRAASAARLSRSSPSEAERAAADLALKRILRSLSIEHLPDPAAMPHAITGGQLE